MHIPCITPLNVSGLTYSGSPLKQRFQSQRQEKPERFETEADALLSFLKRYCHALEKAIWQEMVGSLCKLGGVNG